ncbi:unnamed protein product [Symbiodinium natans]|uniref:Uncharacterized protein n=1 Tax=Symbiodinium natans TaxID=878477 RepID=A0A812KUG3_9DINO|nr:unnamed protein product [Symbiodinium natans]
MLGALSPPSMGARSAKSWGAWQVLRVLVLWANCHLSLAAAAQEWDIEQGKNFRKFFGEPIALACKALPDDAAAPFGIGVIIHPGDICKDALKVGGDEVFNQMAISTDMYEKNNDKAKDADCNGDHAAIQRIWCDLHCIREAVQDGDAAILGSLKEAVDVLDTNFDRLMQYYTGLVGDKVDALAGKKKPNLVEVKESLLAGMGRVQHLVSAPLDQVGRRASQNLLDAFIRDLQNRSSAAEVVEDVERLHASLLHVARGTKLSASAAVAANVGRAAQSMQELARSRTLL